MTWSLEPAGPRFGVVGDLWVTGVSPARQFGGPDEFFEHKTSVQASHHCARKRIAVYLCLPTHIYRTVRGRIYLGGVTNPRDYIEIWVTWEVLSKNIFHHGPNLLTLVTHAFLVLPSCLYAPRGDGELYLRNLTRASPGIIYALRRFRVKILYYVTRDEFSFFFCCFKS